jgi:hypothetical protein
MIERDYTMNIDTTIADSAAAKMTTGSLMTLGEVAARLAVSPMTVHRMPLTSIRLGRSLRFDPRDVAQLIAASREETVTCPIAHPHSHAHSGCAKELGAANLTPLQGSDDVDAGHSNDSHRGEAP